MDFQNEQAASTIEVVKFGANDRLCVNCPISTAKTTNINCPDIESTLRKTKKVNKESQPSQTASLLDNTVECIAVYAILNYDDGDEDDDLSRVWSLVSQAASLPKSFHLRDTKVGKSCKTGAAEKFLKPEKTTNTYLSYTAKEEPGAVAPSSVQRFSCCIAHGYM